MKTDDITQNLGKTLKEFLGFFKNDLQKKVLELDSNVKSKEYFEDLTRVSNSLEQYIQKDVSLFYVGFLGSYSSGKSSTINSLLQIWDTDKARLVNNNPTDTNITLITNQNNVHNVFTFAKEGAIPIRTNTNFDSPFLNNVVLMDTPGSGDPNIIESIVRDSLPLCDLIIYTLNATAPFTDIDKPFLEAQQQKLSNIPIIFVLTRADEYKLKKSLKVSTENFDKKKSQDDLTTIINRINEAIEISEFKETDFTIIDNKDEYNIDVLIKKITQFTNNSNENLLALHNHKLSYFRNEIKSIHNYYLDLTNDKIDKCEKFLTKAKDNIEYFDQQIELSKMKFRALWNENNLIFSRIYDGTVKGYIAGRVEELEEIKTISETTEFFIFRNRFTGELNEKAKELSKDIVKRIDEKANSAVTELKNGVIALLNEETLNISDNLSFDENFHQPLGSPLNEKEYITEFKRFVKRKIIDDNKKLNETIKTITKSLQQKKPLDSINENIISYSQSFVEILNLYYDAIKMYNVVAFSFEVKNYISELGLAKEFDKLESGEINKAKYNLIAEKELIRDFKESSNVFEKRINTNLERLKQTPSSLNQSELSFDSIEENLIENYTKEDDSYSTQEITGLTTDVYRKLIKDLQENLYDLKKDVKSLKKKRIIRYFLFALIPIFGVFAYWLFYQFKDIETPTSLGTTILVGIGCSLVATFISGISDKYKSKRYKRISVFKDEMRTKNDATIREIINEFRNKNSQRETDIAQRILNTWNKDEQALLDILLESQMLDFYNRNIALKKMILKVLESYQETYSEFNVKILELFNNQDDSLDKIDNIASTIKEDSIRPSFELLQKTIEEIKLVKKEITVLDY